MVADSRLSLQTALEKIVGKDHAYFQPPSKGNISLPCIIYTLADIQTTHADNVIYRTCKAYQLILGDKNPDTTHVATLLSSFNTIKFERFYTADGINHWVFTLLY